MFCNSGDSCPACLLERTSSRASWRPAICKQVGQPECQTNSQAMAGPNAKSTLTFALEALKLGASRQRKCKLVARSRSACPLDPPAPGICSTNSSPEWSRTGARPIAGSAPASPLPNHLSSCNHKNRACPLPVRNGSRKVVSVCLSSGPRALLFLYIGVNNLEHDNYS